VTRAAVSSFGAQVTIARSQFECDAIDLNAEGSGDIDDGGDNACGCEDEPGVCQVLSSQLEAPSAPPLVVTRQSAPGEGG
jgi:hypothetical protein